MTKTVRNVFIITFVPIILMMLLMYIFRDKLKDTTGENEAGTVIKVGTSPDYPPFEFIKDGNIEGFDIDLIKILASKVNRRVKIKQIEFSDVVSALDSGKIDIIISAFSADSERAKSMVFSVPYYTTSFSIITKKEGHIHSFEDLLKNSKVGVQIGSIMEKVVNKFNKDNNAFINVFHHTSNSVLIEQLKAGDIDAMIMERAQAPSFIKDEPSLTYLSVPGSTSAIEGQGYVIGFRKDSKIVANVNKAINEMNASGEMDSLLKKWEIY